LDDLAADGTQNDPLNAVSLLSLLPDSQSLSCHTAKISHERIRTLAITDDNAYLLKGLKEYPNLEVLSIRCEDLDKLPDDIGQLEKLRDLSLNCGNGCSMNPILPESMGNLHALEKLDLCGGQDPRPPGTQPTQRHEFPKSMSQLKRLTYLDWGKNGLAEIPDFVKDLPHLKELRFGWNMEVRVFPPFLTNLHELQTLRLEADGLSDIPQFLSKAPRLSLISLGNNCSITTSEPKKKALVRRFPNIKFDFEDEYDCPSN
jgi:Leucine-rich repeat (LRR) protein